MLTFKTLHLKTIDNTILLITLNRPASRNAMNTDMMKDLLMLWQKHFIDEHKIRCIILTGAETAFCAGADLKERLGMTLEVWQKQHAVLQQAIRAMNDCAIPIIAAVNGAAFGGGLELALASDFIYASETATFAQSEVKIGIMPGACGTQHLPRAASLRRAKELTYTAETFTAQQAYEWGIINKVCFDNNLLSDALITAKKISENAPLAIKQVKQALNMSQHLDIVSGYSFEVKAYTSLLSTEDKEEGIRAFNEKRKPVFEGK